MGLAAIAGLGFAASTASAVPLPIDTCSSNPCQTEGGSIDVSLNLLGNGDLEILALNNLVSGAVTQLGFDFEPFTSTTPATLVSFSATTGDVTGPGGGTPDVNVGIGNETIDLSAAFASDGTNAWAPGEAIRLVFDTDPDLTLDLLASATGHAQIQGGCEPANPSPCLETGIGGPQSYRLTGVVPEPSTLLLSGMGLALLGGSRRRTS
jgi:hypothetical protein